MNQVDIRENKPFTTNQITNMKPNVPRSTNVLSGYIGNSLNGGHNKVIAFKKIMAGERHNAYRLKMCIQMLTPKTPTYQNLVCTIRSYFVPNSRVWKNAEKYTAQKGGVTEQKIIEIPNYGGKKIPIFPEDQADKEILLNSSTYWRDAFISNYIPRIGQPGTQDKDYPNWNDTLPKGSILPLRGRIAIYNDMERNKEYDTPYKEYNDDTVSNDEWVSYLPLYFKDGNKYGYTGVADPYKHKVLTGRARRNNSYYSDYRTEWQGLSEDTPDMNPEDGLLNWAKWESMIAEARSEAENAQLNDWQIISKIRGSKLLTEGKVQKIGEKSFNLNYAAVTQNTYNTNNQVDERFQVMGKQGAYSYTEIDIPAYEGVEFIEEGYVHIIATVTADSVYEIGFDRMELNVHPMDEYRPDLISVKDDVLYEIEMDTLMNSNPNTVVGFKRKFSEYFKLPNVINGDISNKEWYDDNEAGEITGQYYMTGVLPNYTFQFFELSNNVFIDPTTKELFYKRIYLDYTDLLINKNQAIKNITKEIWTDQSEQNQYSDIRVTGENQIFFIGKAYCYADLPIDEAIKNNYTKWGEH